MEIVQLCKIIFEFFSTLLFADGLFNIIYDYGQAIVGGHFRLRSSQNMSTVFSLQVRGKFCASICSYHIGDISAEKSGAHYAKMFNIAIISRAYKITLNPLYLFIEFNPSYKIFCKEVSNLVFKRYLMPTILFSYLN